MSSDNGTNGHPVASAPAPMDASPLPTEADGAAQQQVHPLKKLHMLLRGRYLWAILLGGILAAGGAAGGWYYVTPMHQAKGQIAIKTRIPHIMFEGTDQTGPLPMADKFIATQVMLMEQRRVLEGAMASDLWDPYSDGMGPEARHEFQSKLRAYRPRGTNAINISFTHKNPEAAKAAVQAVIESYRTVFRDREVSEDQQRFNVLEDRRNNLMNQISSLNDRVQNVAEDYGPDTLERMYQFQVQQVQELETELRQTELALASAGVALKEQQGQNQDQAAGTDKDQQTERANRWKDLSVRQIGQLDQRMASLLERRRNLEAQMQNLGTRLGKNHRQVKQLDSQLVNLQDRIERYAQTIRDEGPSALGQGEGGGGSGTGLSESQMSVQQLRAKRQQLKNLHEQARQRMRQLGQKQNQIAQLERERQSLQNKLEQTKGRIERLNLESNAAVSGRLVVNNEGEIQPGIVNDGTRKQLALMGFMGGGGLGVGLIMLLGYRDQRMQSAEDVAMFSYQPRMLGMLPNLPRDLADPQNAMLAAYGVHHIRSMLQLASPHAAGRTLAVTGPARETGKTSLTLGLGLSFASAGSRTLLIDCDLTGGGLSRRLQTFIRRRLGQILQRDGTITQQQLEEALKTAEAQNQRIGEVLLASGAIDETTLAEALDSQERQSVGLLDALAGEPLSQCVADSGLDNLSVLPIGDANAADTSRLAPRNLQALIKSAREQFEVVLLDTGPMPGAVESTMAAGVADEAVMIVSRGDQRSDAEEALKTLRSIRVPMAGVVFNRAHQRDLERSARSQSRLSVPSGNGDSPSGVGQGPTDGGRLRKDRFDPLTRAVADAAISGREDQPGASERSSRNGHEKNGTDRPANAGDKNQD
jgi:Mrp family chromosome partitioning ATPase/uncharacterized protein involved in exopolysaccharide biosynthesis